MPSIDRLIEMVSKIGGVVLVSIYGCGYLVISLYYASFGMSEINPLRPKVVAAGLLFLILSAIPLGIMKQGLDRSKKIFTEAAHNDPIHLLWAYSEVAFSAPLFALGVMQIFDLTGRVSPIRLSFLAFLLLLFFAAQVAVANSQKARQIITQNDGIVTIIIFCMLLAGVFLAIPYKGEFGLVQVGLWFFAVAAFGWSVWQKVSQSPGPLVNSWGMEILQILGPLALFPLWVYPHVKPGWGGGEPANAVILFTKDSSLAASQQRQVKIIEESETAVYVLPSSSKKALLIPRSSIAAISYSDQPIDPSLSIH